MTAVQKGAKSSLWVVNLLDEESDEEAPSFLAKVQPEKGVEHPPSSCLKRCHPQRRMVTGRGKEVPTGGSKGADGKDDFMGAPRDSIALLTSEDDKAQGTVGAGGHLIEAKDLFSELGIFSISKHLAF